MREEHLDVKLPSEDKVAARTGKFFDLIQSAEQHWFFVQAVKCYEHELYVPATSSLLNGIEATLRIYVHRYGGEGIDWISEPPAYRVLSNSLILKARDIGLAVERLAFSDERDFVENLESAKPTRRDVRLVALRNNVCHGNVQEFCIDYSGKGDKVFVPEFLRSTVEQLLDISEAWAEELERFRKQAE